MQGHTPKQVLAHRDGVVDWALGWTINVLLLFSYRGPCVVLLRLDWWRLPRKRKSIGAAVETANRPSRLKRQQKTNLLKLFGPKPGKKILTFTRFSSTSGPLESALWEEAKRPDSLRLWRGQKQLCVLVLYSYYHPPCSERCEGEWPADVAVGQVVRGGGRAMV